jgi:hypothetical protein
MHMSKTDRAQAYFGARAGHARCRHGHACHDTMHTAAACVNQLSAQGKEGAKPALSMQYMHQQSNSALSEP